MRYWQHNETGRLLRATVQMVPHNWTEITKEQYEKATLSNAEFLKLVNEETCNIKRGVA